MVRRGKRVAAADEDAALSGDEIDAFHSARDVVALDAAALADSDDDDDEAVMALDADAAGESDEEASDDDADAAGDAGDSQDSEADAEEPAGGWGRKKAAYYDRHRKGADEEQTEDAAQLEEDEARRLQRLRAAAMSAEDFGDVAQAKARLPAPAGKRAKEAAAAAERAPRDLRAMAPEQRVKAVAAEAPELVGLLAEFKAKVATVRDQLAPLIRRVRDGELPTGQGVSFLELKYQLLVQYCTNIAFYLALKAKGEEVKDHPVIAELVRIRTLLEKLRPLERKLKYQIDKLLKTAATGTSDASNPLRFKPRLADMASGSDSEASAGSDAGASDDGEGGAQGKYVAPKLREVAYDEEDADAGERGAAGSVRARAKEAANRRKAAHQSVMQYVRSEFGEEPEEQDVAGSALVAESQASKNKRRFEESAMVRLNETREERLKRARPALVDELRELSTIADIADLEEEQARDDGAEAATEIDAERRAQLGRAVGAAAGSQGQRAARGGDVDLPYRERQQPRQRGAAAEDSGDEDIDSDAADSDGGEGARAARAGEDDDDLYREVAEQARERKRARTEGYERSKQERIASVRKHFEERENVKEGRKRAINKKIASNRGLVRPRKGTTPHERMRNKFHKKERNVQKMRDKSEAYSGEASIKPRMVHATKFK
eukprot:m51a1_g7906 putative small nucleolar RNA U3 (665) ;mRNA; f:161966-164509